MISELRTVVLPHLRAAEFKGTFPHFRRLRESKIDLLSFQFDKYGGGFYIEISQCDRSGYINRRRQHIPASQQLRCWDIDERLRLQPGKRQSRWSWFRYENNDFHSVAESVLPHLEIAEKWWLADKDQQTQVIKNSWEKPGIWSLIGSLHDLWLAVKPTNRSPK